MQGAKKDDIDGLRLGSLDSRRGGLAPVDEHQHVLASDADRLAYVADLVMDLSSLVDPGKYATLSGLLALAHREAMTRSVAVRGK